MSDAFEIKPTAYVKIALDVVVGGQTVGRTEVAGFPVDPSLFKSEHVYAPIRAAVTKLSRSQTVPTESDIMAAINGSRRSTSKRRLPESDYSASCLVDTLLESSVKVCASCEKEGGAVNVPPGYSKTHGYCKRHYREALVNNGFSEADIERLLNKPAEYFCPDTSDETYSHAEHST